MDGGLKEIVAVGIPEQLLQALLVAQLLSGKGHPVAVQADHIHVGDGAGAGLGHEGSHLHVLPIAGLGAADLFLGPDVPNAVPILVRGVVSRREVFAPLGHVVREVLLRGVGIGILLVAVPGVALGIDYHVACLIQHRAGTAHEPLTKLAAGDGDLFELTLGGTVLQQVAGADGPGQIDVGAVVGVIEAARGDVLWEGGHSHAAPSHKAGIGGQTGITGLLGVFHIIEQGIVGVPFLVVGQYFFHGIGLGLHGGTAAHTGHTAGLTLPGGHVQALLNSLPFKVIVFARGEF